jgi:ribosomal protein S18 acetylase RimI-like enzyme
MALRPDLVGTRVVVRHVVPGETGPSGGPALNDVLGELIGWSATELSVRRADGSVATVPQSDVVTAKPVPPRSSTRMRVSAEQACRLSNASWPAVVEEPLGGWLLRASGGFSARANSLMAVGDPGMSLAAASTLAREFYARHALPVWAQVLVGSSVQHDLDAGGWTPARPGEDDTAFYLASTARAARTARALVRDDAPDVAIGTDLGAAWLANDARARAHPDAARRVLAGPEQVGFAGVPAPAGAEAAPLRAKGRVVVHGDWAAVTDVWVSPDHRRQGLAVAVVAAVLDWAAERGATTAYLQVRADNPAALALYERLGFREHHRYRYLVAPG